MRELGKGGQRGDQINSRVTMNVNRKDEDFSKEIPGPGPTYGSDQNGASGDLPPTARAAPASSYASYSDAYDKPDGSSKHSRHQQHLPLPE